MGTSRPLRIAVLGGSGYTGIELLRLLAAHPSAEVVAATSRQHAGKRAGQVHPSLEGVSDAAFFADEAALPEVDLVFSCLPHGESMDRIAAVLRERPALRCVDLGPDFRLPAGLYAEWYGQEHRHPELLEETAFGVPELLPEPIRAARLVANPGCFAHCMMLSLWPLVRAGALSGPARVSAVTGSSGSGAAVKPGTHHPARNDSVSAYNVLAHRHGPEVEQALSRALTGSGSPATRHEPAQQIRFVPHSGPFTRGIFATTFVQLRDGASAEPLVRAFASEKRFVRVRDETPRLLEVRGSNFFDVAVCQHGDDAVIMGSLDNLVKGAAGNAVQCMNVMFGFAEDAGLSGAPLFP